ncbi:ABC transporter permease [Brassicibacter mesophilus]|uniref:ABC transporter permease n=1 Tax=Brassicibacter mesophilus TaxID=745119 RepID=UPI003D1E4E38
MKDFFIVLKFELMNYLRNKAFIISTLVICLLLSIGLSIPTIKDTFSSKKSQSTEELDSTVKAYGYINRDGALSDTSPLKSAFKLGKLVEFDDEKELEDSVISKQIEAGYIIESPTKYQYIVENNEIMDSSRAYFEEALTETYRMTGLEKRGISYDEVKDLISPNIEYDTRILGKDSASNYLYTYILIFGLYFMIILYGQLIATSVASEKSNRVMEILITSTNSGNLIFGKVLGGALAGIIQFGLTILTGRIAYDLNSVAWNNKLDFIFKIPGNVLLTFFIFGILGYLFYSFIFGALGALVSRTEDVSSSSTPVTIMFIVVFFIAIMGMQNTEGVLLKVTSFIPFSSFMSMFVRVSMGTVSTVEVMISLFILAISTVVIGLLASMIYRMGTLMYGNPVKLKSALKLLKKNKI